MLAWACRCSARSNTSNLASRSRTYLEAESVGRTHDALPMTISMRWCERCIARTWEWMEEARCLGLGSMRLIDGFSLSLIGRASRIECLSVGVARHNGRLPHIQAHNRSMHRAIATAH